MIFSFVISKFSMQNFGKSAIIVLSLIPKNLFFKVLIESNPHSGKQNVISII